MEELWQRVSQGHHTALLGIVPGEPPATMGLRVVRVRCDVPKTTLGPLLEAQRKVDLLLGGPPLLDQARSRVVSGLRRRLLGEVHEITGDGELLETLNRLAQQADQRYALVFDAVEACDDATLDALRRIVSRPDALRTPLVLSFRTPEPLGGAGALVAALRATGGPEAVLRTVEGETLAAEVAAGGPEGGWRSLPSLVLRVLRAGALVGSGFEAELLASLLGMEPLEVLETLQRAADAGVPIDDRGEGRFHMPEPLLAELRASLLPSLARAWHRRLAHLLSDGEGAFPVPASAIEESLRLRRPGSVGPRAPAPPKARGEGEAPEVARDREARGEGEAPEVTRDREVPRDPEAPRVEGGERGPGQAQAQTQGSAEEPPRHDAEAPQRASSVPPAPVWPYAELFPHGAEPVVHEASAPSGLTNAAAPTFAPPREPEPARAAPTFAPPREPEPARAAPTFAPPREPEPARAAPTFAPPRAPEPARAATAPGRAATHLTAAGDLDAAAQRYCAAAAQAAAAGAYPQALTYGQQALALLQDLPVTPSRRRMRVAALAQLARVHWQAAGPAAFHAAREESLSPELDRDLAGTSFTLTSALEVLMAARSLLAPDDPPALFAEVAVLIADVCYDLGDQPSLDRALEELTAASRRLLSGGDALAAARLLNDQAAIYVRMGDPVRATHLLGESRKVFEQRAAADPVALLELADTDHLFARIPLHVAARPGREDDALSMGLDHALAAERTYRKVSATRDLGRVWETMGRLELRKKRLDRAKQRLSAAIEVQQATGDLIGLARSTAALSEVLAVEGRHGDALIVLADSITLNLEKGSPIGLAFNRRTLTALAQDISPHSEAAETLRHLADQLAAAEGTLGRIKLPGERD